MEMEMALVAHTSSSSTTTATATNTSSVASASSTVSPAPTASPASPSPSDTHSPLPTATREFPATATPTPSCLKKRPFSSLSTTPMAPVAPLPLAHLQQQQQQQQVPTGPSTPGAAVSACNFSALSHHFHLPLKVAAEKFGVRATAFKKRCRAIGIRHWPYRKVRSLKRSLQELAEFQQQADTGAGPPLTDKQVRQLAVYQSQLTRLLSPETYGIDPIGQLLPQHFFALDDGGVTPCTPDDDSDDDSCGSQSPRVHPSPAAASHHPHLRGLGVTPAHKLKARKHFFSDSPSSAGASPHESLFFSSPMGPGNAAIFDGSYLSGGHGHGGAAAPSACDLPPSASLGFDGLYDPFGPGDDFAPSCGYSLDSVSYDFFPLQSPTMATRKAALAASATSGHAAAASSSSSSSSSSAPPADGLEDDIFRHISPEYGCLV